MALLVVSEESGNTTNFSWQVRITVPLVRGDKRDYIAKMEVHIRTAL